MAIRAPGGRPEALPAQNREQPTSPTQRLVDFGMAKTPQEAVKVLKEILSLLAAAGFPVAKTGTPDQQLSSTLRQFQQQQGLPVTGKLDQQTAAALQREGLAPAGQHTIEDASGKPATSTNTTSTSSTSTTTNAPTKDAVDVPMLRPGFNLGVARLGVSEAPAGTQKGKTLETEQAAARVEHQRPDVEVDLKSMLQSLRSAGFAGVGKGKEQLQDAVKKLQRAEGLPQTGKLDAATAERMERRGVVDSATAQVLKEQDPTYKPPSASTAEDARNNTLSRFDSDVRGSVDGQASSGASGQQETTSTTTGRGSEGGAGTGLEAGADGRVNHGDVDGDSDDIGNNYTGDDDDDDERRGLANRDHDADDLDDDAHWEVPSLGEQLEEALDAVVRDDDVNGAATYSWQFVLHKPGVYSARQPAEELLKVAVNRAGPFDPAWQQAVLALNERLERADDVVTLSMQRLKQALQQARYR
jgi:peptidoglycan hydrolase-like protein with peptidoglycan-binding domain